jgi:hypothetical protein
LTHLTHPYKAPSHHIIFPPVTIPNTSQQQVTSNSFTSLKGHHHACVHVSRCYFSASSPPPPPPPSSSSYIILVNETAADNTTQIRPRRTKGKHVSTKVTTHDCEYSVKVAASGNTGAFVICRFMHPIHSLPALSLLLPATLIHPRSFVARVFSSIPRSPTPGLPFTFTFTHRLLTLFQWRAYSECPHDQPPLLASPLPLRGVWLSIRIRATSPTLTLRGVRTELIGLSESCFRLPVFHKT